MAIKKTLLNLFSTKSVQYTPSGGATGPVVVGMSATGGTVYDYTNANGTFRAHVFTTSGTFTITSLGSQYNTLDILAVGAGTCGFLDPSYYYGAGGGGGNVIYYGGELANSVYANSTTAYTATGPSMPVSQANSFTVVVGAGMAAGSISTTQSTYTRAQATTIVSGNISISANGGTAFADNSGNPPLVYCSSGELYTVGNTSRKVGHARGGGGGILTSGSPCGISGQVYNSTYSSYRGGHGGGAISFGIMGTPIAVGGGGPGSFNGVTPFYGGAVQYRSYSGVGTADNVAPPPNTGTGGAPGYNNSGATNGSGGIAIFCYRRY